MLGHFGFSYIGLIWLLLLIIPNLIWTKYQPQGYSPENENKILLFLERVGEICVSGSALIFSDYSIGKFTPWSLWLLGSFLAMLLYEIWWIRYFRSPRAMKDFYRSFCGIPVAGASLPVFAFLLLGIYGRVVWMLVSVLILGVGHIGIHLQHRKELEKQPCALAGER